MNDTKKPNLLEPHDVLAAFALLTRLPVPVIHKRAGERAATASWAYPIVGAAVGILAGLVAITLQALLLPTAVTAALTILFLIAVTGAIHEDGLADCADGFWGGTDSKSRLEIMKDSSIGVYGAVVLIVFLLAEWSALNSILLSSPVSSLAIVGSISRLPMVFAMHFMPTARQNGLSAGVGKPPMQSIVIATILTIVLVVLFTGTIGIGILLFGLLFATPILLIAKQKIGGQTGDVLGASQKCSELGAFIALLIL